MQEWSRRNPEKKKANDSKSYFRNRKNRLEKMKVWAAKNVEMTRAIKRKYYEANREAVIDRAVEYNRTKQGKENRARWSREEAKRNPSYKLGLTLRSRIWWALKSQNAKKLIRTKDLIGCPIEFLKKHLEAQFEPGMTWENHGEWHIDHRMPCSRFDLTDLLQQKICFHFTNLQPLWAVENLSKGAR